MADRARGGYPVHFTTKVHIHRENDIRLRFLADLERLQRTEPGFGDHTEISSVDISANRIPSRTIA